MATERDAQCPECGGTRRTKAARGVRITCFDCGHTFRAPAVEPTDAQPPAEQTAPAPNEAKAAAPKPAKAAPSSDGDVVVKRATSVKINRNAHVRKPAATAKAPAESPSSTAPGKGRSEGGGEPGAARPAPAPPLNGPGPRAKSSGARGGSRWLSERLRRGA